MIGITYYSVNGGVNNLVAAHDTKTGECSTSFIDKEHAIRALKRKLAKKRKQEEKQ